MPSTVNGAQRCTVTVEGIVFVTVFLPFLPNSTVFGKGAKTIGLALPGSWGVNTFCTTGMQPCKIFLFLTTQTILARSHYLYNFI